MCSSRLWQTATPGPTPRFSETPNCLFWNPKFYSVCLATPNLFLPVCPPNTINRIMKQLHNLEVTIWSCDLVMLATLSVLRSMGFTKTFRNHRFSLISVTLVRTSRLAISIGRNDLPKPDRTWICISNFLKRLAKVHFRSGTNCPVVRSGDLVMIATLSILKPIDFTKTFRNHWFSLISVTFVIIRVLDSNEWPTKNSQGMKMCVQIVWNAWEKSISGVETTFV